MVSRAERGISLLRILTVLSIASMATGCDGRPPVSTALATEPPARPAPTLTVNAPMASPESIAVIPLGGGDGGGEGGAYKIVTSTSTPTPTGENRTPTPTPSVTAKFETTPTASRTPVAKEPTPSASVTPNIKPSPTPRATDFTITPPVEATATNTTATPPAEIISTKTLSETTAADLGLPEGAEVKYENNRFWVTGYGAEKFVLGAPTKRPTKSDPGAEWQYQDFRMFARVASQPYTDTDTLHTLIDEQGNEKTVQSVFIEIEVWDSATQKFLPKKAIVTLNQQDKTEKAGGCNDTITYDANNLFYSQYTAVKSTERKWITGALFSLSIQTDYQRKTGYDTTNQAIVDRVTFMNSLFGHPYRGFHLKENVDFPTFEELEKWQKTGAAPESEYLGLVSISCPLPPPKNP